jgi:lipopolysaccharide/colanic/teichoic acid biosynthesis glycosyltransferase
MRVDAEANGPVWAHEGDPRVTRVGRWIRKLRIDELPQLFNIIRGEMSLIGPRPERPVFIKQLERQIPYYSERHLVKPGLTGWAQVRYPYGASLEDAMEKHKYDLYYIKNQSRMLDLLIRSKRRALCSSGVFRAEVAEVKEVVRRNYERK